MPKTKEEYAALDALTARIFARMCEGEDVTVRDARALNTPFSCGKTGRTKALSAEDVLRAHIDAHIRFTRERGESR